jgi:hypothetical protein
MLRPAHAGFTPCDGMMRLCLELCVLSMREPGRWTGATSPSIFRAPPA